MRKINVIMCCGSGMSSGYLAVRTRKAAKKKDILLSLEAVPQSDISTYINDGHTDMILLAPHFKSQYEQYKKIAEGKQIIIEMIPEDIYGYLDGDALIDFIENNYKERSAR